MDNTQMKKVVFMNIKKMLLVGMEGKPFIKDDDEDSLIILCETYFDALEDSGYREKDAIKVNKCWRAMIRTQSKWFQPARLIESVRSTYVQADVPALPQMSEGQRLDNLKRLAEMKRGMFKETH